MRRCWLVVGYSIGIAFALLIGCVQEPEGYESTSGDRTAQASTIAAGEKIKVKTANDQPVVEFKLRDDRVTIEVSTSGASRILRGETNEKDKRKYEWEDGTRVAEVKPNDDGFKVRTPDGKLLWKVKTNPDKVKISNNEENTNPFELEWKGQDRVKVTLGQTELGKMKFYGDRQKVKVKDANERELFESNTNHASAAYGVLLLQTIPKTERYIIMAELLARGK
jgi:hypothetical protein